MTKTLARALAATATISVFGLTSCAAPAATDDDSPIRIGLVTSLTGPFSTLGEGNLEGAQAAIALINEEGGVDGRQLELVYRDDKTVADQSVVSFNELAADSSIVAVLGSTDSTSATAVAPAAERSGLTYLALSPVTALASGENPYAFIAPATTANYAKALVDYWVAEGYEKIAVAYDSADVFGTSGFESTVEYADAAGIDIVFEESFDPTASDYTALLTKAGDSEATGLLVWNAGPASVIIAKQAYELGLDEQMFFTGAQGSNLWLDPTGEAAEGTLLATGIASSGRQLPDGELKDQIDRIAEPYFEETGTYPSEFFFAAASATFLLAAAIEDAGGSDRDAIRDSLASLDLLAPTGHFTYSDSEDHGGLGTDAIVMVQVVDGTFTLTPYQEELFETTLAE